MEGKKEGPERSGKTQLEEIREMLGKCLQQQSTLLQRQEEDRQTAEDDKQDIMHRFDNLEPRLDSLEKQAAQDRKEAQKQYAVTQMQLQKQGKQCEIMQATLQQSLTAQNAHILQIQSDGADNTQKVKLLGQQHEQTRTEARADRTRLTTLEADVKEMRHEHSTL